MGSRDREIAAVSDAINTLLDDLAGTVAALNAILTGQPVTPSVNGPDAETSAEEGQ